MSDSDDQVVIAITRKEYDEMFSEAVDKSNGVIQPGATLCSFRGDPIVIQIVEEDDE